MDGPSYADKLNKLDVYLLHLRRLRGELIETRVKLRGLEKVDQERAFLLVGESRQDVSYKK